jgi:poly(hydroxyalkanoate) depolymerase family esterase
MRRRTGRRKLRSLIDALIPPVRRKATAKAARSTAARSTAAISRTTRSTATRATSGKATDTATVTGTPAQGAVKPAPKKTDAKATPRVTWYEEQYAGPAGARSYAVYVPPRLNRRTRAPLVVLLHGCRQTPTEFAAATGFNELADRRGFVVAYPAQSTWHHRQRCWHWYESAHQARGSGEPALLAEVTRTVLAERGRWRIDPERVYVAGLSAGGAMALILAATYPDLYAAVGVHSAPAYRSASTSAEALAAMAGRTRVPAPEPNLDGAAGRGMPPAVVFQGALDAAVHARNGMRVAEQWLAFHAARTAADNDPDRVSRQRTTNGRAGGGRT